LFVVCVEKKRKSRKTTKKTENKDDNGVKAAAVNSSSNKDDSSNTNNIIKVTEDGESLQNGHCRVQTEKAEEEHDVVSDLPDFRRSRKLSRNLQPPTGDNCNDFRWAFVIAEMCAQSHKNEMKAVVRGF